MNRGVITILRDMVPIRPLTRTEALRIAELQANRFIHTVGLTEPPVREHLIADLPRIDVKRFRPMPVSGATQWSHGQWMILLNATEPEARQRFSLAHEFKHILDHRFIHVLYQRIPEADRDRFVESVCDYFAGCLLVPKTWLKNAWASGIQDTHALAARFGVSEYAIKVRLSQTGLVTSPPRCANVSRRWTLPPIERTRYQRTPAALPQ